jgi:signal transduction histidine kinase
VRHFVKSCIFLIQEGRSPGPGKAVSESVNPAFSSGHLFRRMPVVVWLPVVAAVALLVFTVSHASAVEEFLLLAVTVGVLALGHALMRTRARRAEAEAEARRLADEAELRARVGECEQRRQSLAAFAQLAAHVAHEVRNPLNAIMLNGELLEEEVRRCNCPGAEEASTLIRSIQQEAARLQHLTDEYLAFARPPRPAMGHHSLNAIVDDLAHLVREEAARQGVAIETRLSRDCPCALLDPQQMKQAALNLVRNAIQAMPAGGRLTLETAVLPDGAVALSVEDTGPGIPEDQRCQIFEPFFTSKAGGTGLGLPLAMHIVRDHDGEIDVRNVPGAGARFTVTLPASRSQAGPCTCGTEVPAAGAAPCA